MNLTGGRQQLDLHGGVLAALVPGPILSDPRPGGNEKSGPAKSNLSG
jgi:hypothetical protein